MRSNNSFSLPEQLLEDEKDGIGLLLFTNVFLFTHLARLNRQLKTNLPVGKLVYIYGFIMRLFRPKASSTTITDGDISTVPIVLVSLGIANVLFSIAYPKQLLL